MRFLYSNDWSLKLKARMNSHDAVRVVGVRRALEARVLHHGLKLLLRWELADTLHQVLQRSNSVSSISMIAPDQGRDFTWYESRSFETTWPSNGITLNEY